MKLYQLLQAFEVKELFPEINNMFPNANLHRDVYEKAFQLACELKPIASKKVIRYEVMNDPDTNEMFYGSDDKNFEGPWEVVIGKEIKKEKGVDLNDTEIAANCLLNLLMISRCPKSFEPEYRKLMK